MKLKQILAIVLSVALVACISVAATVAYLTSADEVVNTFTIGRVDITLDEENVDNKPDSSPDRDKKNEYQLFPGKEYKKDPTVHVKATSEECYLFVKVENGIKEIESTAADYESIEAQILNNGWKLVTGETNVYYTTHNKMEGATDTTPDKNYVVFSKFTIDSALGNDDLTDYTGDLVTVTAYAIQTETFNNNVVAAWNAVKDVTVSNDTTGDQG